MDPAKLKVVELRAELGKRGLDTKGNKPVLVERLKEALEREKSGEATPPTESFETDQVSESEDDATEPAKLPPRTPSRSSRHTSREPATPAKTPTRRSSSRSSLSRQSPAKSTAIEIETASTLEPIVEEDKTSLKKEAEPSPKKEVAPESLFKKEVSPIPSPKKEDVPAPSTKKESESDNINVKKEIALVTTPKKESELTQAPSKKEVTQTISPKKESELNPVTPKKETTLAASPMKESESNPVSSKKESEPNVEMSKKETAFTSPKKISELVLVTLKKEVSPIKPEDPVTSKGISQNESLKKDETLQVVKEAERHEGEKSQQITRRRSDEVKKPVSNAAESGPIIQDSNKAVEVSPVQSIGQSPVKSDTESSTKDVTQNPSKQSVTQQSSTIEATDSSNKNFETDEVEKIQTEKDISEESKDKSESMEVDQESGDKSEDQQNEKDEKTDDRKRKRSPSPHEEAPRAPPVARPENEPIYDENSVLLSWYDSDLNLVINTINFVSASPMQGDGFNYMWAGARASHGFNKGKVFYEAKVTNEFDNIAAATQTSHRSGGDNSGAIPVDDQKVPSLLRLGWSTIGASLQLGEEKLSYGYEGSGKKSTNNEFTDYGKTFGKNDIVGCFADFETDGNVTLTYTVNGESQGPAFVISKEELEGKVLLPHLLAKNCTFSVNFGQEEAWNEKILDGYTCVGKVDINNRVAGPRRPEKREDCEVILLCGLPFSGKTSWATKHVAENSEKMYSVLGTHNLIEKMKVDGVPLKENFKGRWETLVEKCSRALNKLLESAPSRRRNYILDQQANVYGSAQRRKMRNFYGFHRKAVVLVPTDEEFKSRIAKRKEMAEGEEIREESILEFKANITSPTVGESFEEVIWPELVEDEGKKLIETYNIEGKTAGYGQSQQQNKRSRYDNGQNRNNRDRRPGFNDRRSGGPWRGGPGGGWRDGGRMGGSPMRGSRGYGPPGVWRGGRGASLPPRGGAGNDRRNSGNRQGGRPGGWNSMGYQGGNTGVWANQGNWQGQSQGGWSGSQGQSWGSQQQAWGGAGNWKGYGQNNYSSGSTGSSGYGSSGQSSGNYGNGNWSNWNAQYYNQYWGSGQQGSGGQTQATSSSTGNQAVSKK